MNKSILNTLLFCLIIFQFSCKQDNFPDSIIFNGNIYTVDEKAPSAEAIAIKDGKIMAIGSNTDIEKLGNEATIKIDASGNFVMPGFIEGHGHFSGLGYSLINLNFLNSKSWEEIVSMVGEKVKNTPTGEWIIGRGWHQEKWDSLPNSNYDTYPLHNDLSSISPDNPVVLFHASGHSLFANEKAMQIAGVSKEMGDPAGGRIVRNKEGKAIGVFEERAMENIGLALGEYRDGLSKEEEIKKWKAAIELAQKECLENGVTSFQDAGSRFYELNEYKRMAENGEFDIRLWAMARHSSEEMKDSIAKYKCVDVGNKFFTCNAIKSEVDGALGAFGAWLLKPYNDKPGFVGQNTTDMYEVKKIAEIALENDMQFCVHAIGDRANRLVVDIYEGMLGNIQNGTEKRWRIEHAQHLDTVDIPRFAKNGIIASMQGIHCTSDAPFVEKRLGEERSKYGAYPWRSLLDAGVKIANGTDVPVEDIDPIASFYASVTRKRADNGFEFFPEQKMTRAEAINSYTLDNAFAAFEEKDKGSLEVGKLADIVILSNDLIKCSDEDILNTKVLYTIVGGEVKYKKE
jgi:hypothetical protein